MELYAEILAQYLSTENPLFPRLTPDAKEIVEMKCYQALQRIKRIVEDDSLDDPACFERIEQIVCVLEDIGSDGGTRHDFG